MRPHTWCVRVVQIFLKTWTRFSVRKVMAFERERERETFTTSDSLFALDSVA